ncbi:hypothetical protein D3C81_1909740 [compost metagenome]
MIEGEVRLLILEQHRLAELHLVAGVGDDQLSILFAQQLTSQADHDQPLDTHRQARLRLDQIKLELGVFGAGAHQFHYGGAGRRLVIRRAGLGRDHRGCAQDQGRSQPAKKT